MSVQKNRKQSKKDRLREALIWEIDTSQGVARDRVKKARKGALEYYYCHPRSDDVDGRSKVISPDCRAMTDAAVAQLVDMVSQDGLAQFEADGEQDEASAQLESKVLNAIIQEHNQGPVILQDCIFDALAMGDGVVKFSAEESETQTVETVEGLDDRLAVALQIAEQPNEFRELVRDKDDDTRGTLTITTTNVEFKLHAVAAERFLYDMNHDTHDLNDTHFHGEEMTRTRSQLIEEGFDKSVIYDIPAAEMDTNEASRKRNNARTNYKARATADQEDIELHDCFIRIDLDGDGKAELYRALIANKDVVLEYEEVEHTCYVLGAALLAAQRLHGQSYIEILKPVQDIKTAIWRQRLDNHYIANVNRVVYDPRRASEEDILNPTAGGGIQSKDPGNAVVPLPVMDMGPSSDLATVQANAMRTELGGAALDMASADAQLIGETAHGIERQMGNRELHIALMARNIAETLLTPLFLMAHRVMRTYAVKPMTMKIKGEWTEIDPRQWPERKRVNITTGDSMGVKRLKATTLQLALQVQQQAIQSGMSGVLADTSTIYKTYTDILRLGSFDNPAQYAIDPETPEAQQAAQQNQQVAQQEKAQLDRLAQMQAQNETQKLSVELASIQREAEQQAAELQFKYAELAAKMEMKEAELVGGATLELQRQQAVARDKSEGNEQSEKKTDTGGATVN